MKTAVITGANRGIGLALCQKYLAQGWQVYGICRAASIELNATDTKVIEGIDVTSADALIQLPALLAKCNIDLLINNAGILHHDSLEHIDYTSLTQQVLVNAIAPLRISEVLLGLFSANAKIAFITSRMGSIADNTSGGYYGYRMSKAALNAAAVSFSHDVKSRGIAVAILHPGYVQTAMVNFGGDITADEAAGRLYQRIDELNMTTTGGFWHSNGERLPW
jgi:NAD(P)-dependent dehydrogenase (short-subunit alcohol dehydrogenase family)